MTCKRCGSICVNVQSSVTEKREHWWIYLILLFVPVIGWITLFYLVLSKRSKFTEINALCQNCGHYWQVDKDIESDSQIDKKLKNLKAINAIVIAFFLMSCYLSYSKFPEHINNSNRQSSLIFEVLVFLIVFLIIHSKKQSLIKKRNSYNKKYVK